MTTDDASLFVEDRPEGEWRRIPTVMPGSLVEGRADGQTLYAAFNGLYRSTDGGQVWRRLSCELFVRTVKVSADQQTIYVGAEGGVADSGKGGLYRSTDGGKSWRRFTSFPQSDPYAPDVGSIAIQSDAPQNVYVEMNIGGVQVSRDGGGHWRFDQITSPRNGLQGALGNLAFGPGRTPKLWAGTDHGVLWSNTDASHWTKAGLRPRAPLALDAPQVVPDLRFPGIVYAITQGRFLWRTLDDGRHWRALRTLPSRELTGLTIQPETDDLFLWSGRTILHSTDHGTSWTRLPALPASA